MKYILQHEVKISANSEMVERETFVELSSNISPKIYFISTSLLSQISWLGKQALSTHNSNTVLSHSLYRSAVAQQLIWSGLPDPLKFWICTSIQNEEKHNTLQDIWRH